MAEVTSVCVHLDVYGFVPLIREQTVERVVHFLVVSYPYSNMRYVMALPGETSGCVCHGLGEVFARVGMAPRVVVSGQRHGRWPPQRGRHGHADRDVPAVLRAVRVRGEVLQSVLGQREGQRGERGRVRVPQPDGAGPVGGGVPGVDARVVRRVRTARAGRPLPAWRARRRPVRDGERQQGRIQTRPPAPAGRIPPIQDT